MLPALQGMLPALQGMAHALQLSRGHLRCGSAEAMAAQISSATEGSCVAGPLLLQLQCLHGTKMSDQSLASTQ